MAGPLSGKDIVELVNEQMMPIFEEEKDLLDTIDRWSRWEHDKPHTPRTANKEYKELSERSQTPWLGLVVSSVAQSLYVEGFRSSDGNDAKPWRYWQANGLDRRQMAIHRAALSYGSSYAVVLPGELRSGEPMPSIRGVSARNMVALYGDDLDDDYPTMALRVDKEPNGAQLIRVYDDVAIYRIQQDSEGKLTYVDHEIHGAEVCPVVRFANHLDLEGRSHGEVEPFIPVAARIDQTTFDRLVVQRFSSWVVRTVAGMAPPEKDENLEYEKLRLRAEDILIAEDPDTKFGSLPASPLDGFIAAKDADIRDLAAVTQTPPHHLLGQVSNLSAEALAAAEATLDRKVTERRHSFGESWEQTLRLAAWVDGDKKSAEDYESQVRWRDVGSRSLAQTADALGKLAQMLGVPPEGLWDRIPGTTQQDVAKWKEMARTQGALNMLMSQMGSNAAPSPKLTQPDAPQASPAAGNAGALV